MSGKHLHELTPAGPQTRLAETPPLSGTNSDEGTVPRIRDRIRIPRKLFQVTIRTLIRGRDKLYLSTSPESHGSSVSRKSQRENRTTRRSPGTNFGYEQIGGHRGGARTRTGIDPGTHEGDLFRTRRLALTRRHERLLASLDQSNQKTLGAVSRNNDSTIFSAFQNRRMRVENKIGIGVLGIMAGITVLCENGEDPGKVHLHRLFFGTHGKRTQQKPCKKTDQ